jgi:hypothetical protein
VRKWLRMIWVMLRRVQPSSHRSWVLVLRYVRKKMRRELTSLFLPLTTTKRRKQSNSPSLTTHPVQSHPSNSREMWRKKTPSLERKLLFTCFVVVHVTWMSFAFVVRELRRDALTMLETYIMMSSLIFHLALSLVLHLALLLVLCLISLIDLTIANMVLVHKRTTLCPGALVMAHILIVVIIFRVGLIFLLEDLTLTLSPDAWTVHIFSVVVHDPLGQMVKCKEVWRHYLVAWLSVVLLRSISLTLALSHRPFLILCSWWTEVWRTCGWWISFALDTWPHSLNGSSISLLFFSCVWFFWEFGLRLFS